MVLRLIRQLLNRESTTIITLDYLMVIAKREEEKQSLREVIHIRRENDERLKLIYYQYVQELPEVDQMTFEKPETFKLGIQSELSFLTTRLRMLNELLRQVNENYKNLVEEVVSSENGIKAILQELLERK